MWKPTIPSGADRWQWPKSYKDVLKFNACDLRKVANSYNLFRQNLIIAIKTINKQTRKKHKLVTVSTCIVRGRLTHPPTCSHMYIYTSQPGNFSPVLSRLYTQNMADGSMFFLLLSFLAVSVSSQEVCTKVDDCSCKKSNGKIISLRNIDDKSGPK